VPNLDETNAPHHYNALCWILTEDELVHEHEICDGTLLQRFIIAFFFFQSENLKLLLNSHELHRKHTCEWDGIMCDESEKFVNHLNFTNQNLIGTVSTEIGLLTTLHTIDLSNNVLTGTINMNIYSILPNLTYLDLSANEFEGDIPAKLLEKQTLRTLILKNNQFVGSLSNEIIYPEHLEMFTSEIIYCKEPFHQLY